MASIGTCDSVTDRGCPRASDDHHHFIEAHGQLDVEGDRRPRPYLHGVADGRTETGQAERHLVGAGRQLDVVRASAVGHGGADRVSSRATGLHGDARQHQPRRVGDPAGQRRVLRRQRAPGRPRPVVRPFAWIPDPFVEASPVRVTTLLDLASDPARDTRPDHAPGGDHDRVPGHRVTAPPRAPRRDDELADVRDRELPPAYATLGCTAGRALRRTRERLAG